MVNPITWFVDQYNNWKQQRLEKKLESEIQSLMNQVVNVLVEKSYFLQNRPYDKHIIDRLEDNVNVYEIVLYFDEKIDILPDIPNGAIFKKHAFKREGTWVNPLCVIVKSGADMEALKDKILELFTWACHLPSINSDDFWTLIRKRLGGERRCS